MPSRVIRQPPPSNRDPDALAKVQCDLSDLDRLIMSGPEKCDGAHRALAKKVALDYMDCTLALQGLPSPSRLTQPQMLTVLEESRGCVERLREAQAIGAIRSTMSPAELITSARANDCQHFLAAAFIDAVDPMALDAARTRSPRSRRPVIAATECLLRAQRHKVKQAWWARVRVLLHVQDMPIGDAVKALHDAGERHQSPATTLRLIQQFQSDEQRRAVWTRRPENRRGRPSAKSAYDALCACALEVMKQPGFQLRKVDEFVSAVLRQSLAPSLNSDTARRVVYARRVIRLGTATRGRMAKFSLGKTRA